MIKITQIKSCIGCKPVQRRTIRALGLKHLNDSVMQEENPVILGMVKRVEHMVKVSQVEPSGGGE
ncbi:MAG: 50S ribosomal protein L30 [Candidatus Geothermincolia bacterium]